MIRDTATCRENHERFIRRIIESETVWYLSDNESHTAYCYSNDDDFDEDVSVLMFCSDEAYANRARKSEFTEYSVKFMSLFDFLYRWLPGMTGDGVLAGTNWTGDLVGLEFKPYDLRVEIEGMMSKEPNDRYLKLYKKSISK